VYANIPTARGMEIVITDHTYGAVAMGAERLASPNASSRSSSRWVDVLSRGKDMAVADKFDA
jgi:hypothetical protein